MKKACLIGAVILGLGITAGATAEARQGPYIGFDIVANFPQEDVSDDLNVDPGAGFDIKFGYMFSAPLALEIEWGGTGHDADGEDAGIGFLGINLRYIFETDQPMKPYVRFGVASYALVVQDVVEPGTGRKDDYTLTGGGFDLGVGFDFWINPKATFGVGLTQRFINYDDLDYLDKSLPKDVDGNMLSLNFGLQYHF